MSLIVIVFNELHTLNANTGFTSVICLNKIFSYIWDALNVKCSE